MTTYIFSDLNVRDENVTTSSAVMLYDTEVVVQSVWRLLTTEEGEVPNFRAYGLNIKKFSQYPLTEETANAIYEYIKGQITTFEGRAKVIQANADADLLKGTISYSLIIQVTSTGETVKLPTWTIQVGG